MIKYTINYKDFDDKEQEETLLFHLNTSVGMPLVNKIKVNKKLIEKAQKDINNVDDETLQFLVDLINDVIELIKLSYGERDGDMFIQNEETYKRASSKLSMLTLLDRVQRDQDVALDFISKLIGQ